MLTSVHKSGAVRLALGLLIAPGIFPLVATLLVKGNVAFLPEYVSHDVFLKMTMLLYVTNVPLFLILRTYLPLSGVFAVAGATLPTGIFTLFLFTLAIPTQDELTQAMRTYKFVSLWLLALGGASGVLFWLISLRRPG